MKKTITTILSLLLLSAFSQTVFTQNNSLARDEHSYSNPAEVRVKHVALDLNVLFERKTLQGSVVLNVERSRPASQQSLILDTRNLKITKAETSTNGKNFATTTFNLGQADKILGAPLTINLPPRATHVRVSYETSPDASGVQWLSPAQTAGKRHPFLFTQAQAIHARSFIPLQDSPGVRVTYTARIRTPKDLLAVMSAENDPQTARDGDYTFRMRQPIPAYLIALAVGDLAFRPIGARTGVYAETSVVEKAAKEFEDTERMVKATEELYGPYRWSTLR